MPTESRLRGCRASVTIGSATGESQGKLGSLPHPHPMADLQSGFTHREGSSHCTVGQTEAGEQVPRVEQQ